MSSSLEPIHNARDVLQFRDFSPLDNQVFPLIFSRSPASFKHQATVYDVSKDHQYYSELKSLVCNWYFEVPEGDKVLLNCTGKHDYDEIEARKWYIVDLREQADTFANQIVLCNWSKVPRDVQTRIMFDLYQRSKGLVVFCDNINDVPRTLLSLCVLGLTAKGDPRSLRDITMNGTSHTPMDIEVRYSSTTKYPNLLLGYHRFNEMQTYVYWPCFE